MPLGRLMAQHNPLTGRLFHYDDDNCSSDDYDDYDDHHDDCHTTLISIADNT
jgi:hypothetical protein